MKYKHVYYNYTLDFAFYYQKCQKQLESVLITMCFGLNVIVTTSTAVVPGS